MEKMKSYKLVNSKEAQKKALILGYKISVRRHVTTGDFLFLNTRGQMFDSLTDLEEGYTEAENFDQVDFEYINTRDFLNLEEPIKVGDWVNFDGYAILKVTEIRSCLIFSGHDTDKGYHIERCKKLTDEQVELVGSIIEC